VAAEERAEREDPGRARDPERRRLDLDDQAEEKKAF
jgi:hypothetical protein